MVLRGVAVKLFEHARGRGEVTWTGVKGVCSENQTPKRISEPGAWLCTTAEHRRKCAMSNDRGGKRRGLEKNRAL